MMIKVGELKPSECKCYAGLTRHKILLVCESFYQGVEKLKLIIIDDDDL